MLGAPGAGKGRQGSPPGASRGSAALLRPHLGFPASRTGREDVSVVSSPQPGGLGYISADKPLRPPMQPNARRPFQLPPFPRRDPAFPAPVLLPFSCSALPAPALPCPDVPLHEDHRALSYWPGQLPLAGASLCGWDLRKVCFGCFLLRTKAGTRSKTPCPQLDGAVRSLLLLLFIN